MKSAKELMHQYKVDLGTIILCAIDVLEAGTFRDEEHKRRLVEACQDRGPCIHDMATANVFVQDVLRTLPKHECSAVTTYCPHLRPRAILWRDRSDGVGKPLVRVEGVLNSTGCPIVFIIEPSNSLEVPMKLTGLGRMAYGSSIGMLQSEAQRWLVDLARSLFVEELEISGAISIDREWTRL